MKKNMHSVTYIYIQITFIIVPIEAYLEPYQKSKMESFSRIVNGYKTLKYFCKTLHLRCVNKSLDSITKNFKVKQYYILVLKFNYL